MIKTYYWLAKPGIIYGNAFSVVAGFFLASRGQYDWFLLLTTLFGISFIIGWACVWNNVYDRKIDARMTRTKNRALVTGKVSVLNAMLFGTILGVGGALVLGFYINTLTLVLALFGAFVYIALYTPLKHQSSLSLYIGAVSGAVPPVVGYVAVAGQLDIYALGLFIVLYIWQIVHFVAIAIFRFDEYTAAGIPLVIRREPSAVAKQRARTVFRYSLIALLLFCFALMLQR